MENNFKPEELVYNNESEKQEYKKIILWHNVIKYAFIHLGMFYGFYLMFTSANWKTSLFGLILEQVSGLGLSAGAHRLWSHRSYEAKWPLRVFLCLMHTMAMQFDIYSWARDHRVHHKFSETNADPHNIKRGFFFAHFGWLMCKKHPDVIAKGKAIYLDDVWNDPIVRFQRRFYTPLALIFSLYLPTMIPVWYWGETVWNSFFINVMVRLGISLNSTFLVNSVAHTYGNQPYDKRTEARESPIMSIYTLGEGWHNYHHAFPWDYSSSELKYSFNLTKLFIDAMSKIGLAYNLKTASQNVIEARKLKYGDGINVNFNN